MSVGYTFLHKNLQLYRWQQQIWHMSDATQTSFWLCKQQMDLAFLNIHWVSHSGRQGMLIRMQLRSSLQDNCYQASVIWSLRSFLRPLLPSKLHLRALLAQTKKLTHTHCHVHLVKLILQRCYLIHDQHGNIHWSAWGTLRFEPAIKCYARKVQDCLWASSTFSICSPLLTLIKWDNTLCYLSFWPKGTPKCAKACTLTSYDK